MSVDEDGIQRKPNLEWIVQYFLSNESRFCFVVILCMIVSPMLLWFFGYHINLIRLGYTTNESDKAKTETYLLGMYV